MVFEFNLKDNSAVTFQKMNQNVVVLQKNLQHIDKQVIKFSESLSIAKTAAAGAMSILGVRGASAIRDLATEMANSYDSANKLSQNIGITAESVLGLRHAAELSNVGAEAMDRNMEKLSKTMFEAASGNKAAGESFARLGIEVKNSDGTLKKSDQVLREMADKFKELPPGAERASAAMSIFGKSGASMVSMLKDGSEGLKKMTDDGEAAAGNVKNIAEAMETLKDAGTEAKAALMGMLAGIADSDIFRAVVGGFKDLSSAMINWRKESKAADAAKLNKDMDALATATAKYALQMQVVANLQSKIVEAEGSLEKFEEYTQKKAKYRSVGTQASMKEYGDLAKALSFQKGLQEQADRLQIKLTAAKADDLEIQKKILEGEQQAYNNMKEAGVSNLKLLKEKISTSKGYVKSIIAERQENEKNSQEEAKNLVLFEQKEAAKKKAEQEREAAMKKAAQLYEAESKRLQDFLENYQKSKRTESEIAEDNYNKELENFDALLARKKISQTEHSVYAIAAEGEYQAKLKEIASKQSEERLKNEEAVQGKVWELRRIAAKNSGDIAEIEIEQIRVKYEKEIKMAEDAKIDTVLIKRAEEAEIASIMEKSMESERQQQELIRSYRETAAESDAERMAIQMESINAKYDAELEKARGNAEMIVEIERAKNAELQRMDAQLFQMRLDQAAQYLDASMDLVQSMAVLGKAGGNSMKALSIAQATINTSLAATKAATAAPFPFNAVLVAGAIAQGAVQIANIKAQKFYRGGMIPGANTLIMANEQGGEAILNTAAVRAVGGEAGVNALNRGTSNTYDNSRSSTVSINVNAAVLTQKTFRDEIEPVLRRAERRR